MTLAEKQARLVEDYGLIPDPQERLAAVVDRARTRPPLPAEERTDAHRIPGCVSQAWLVAELRDGVCRFRTDADSPLVRGLLALLADFYTGAAPAEVAANEPTLLTGLGLTRNLSPTRLNGLAAATAAMRAFARAHA